MRIKLSTDKVQLFSFFLLISFIGSLLLSLPAVYKSGVSIGYLDALFTAVSAVCVTGLSTVSMDIYTPFGFVIIMVIIQLGGLGIISFVSLYLVNPRKRVSLVNRGVIKDFFIDDVESNPKTILRSIITFTLMIELLCSVFLYFAFKRENSAQPLLDALFHSVSAFCNAGFSTYQESLALFSGNKIIIGIVVILIVSGGLGFIVLTDILNSIILRKKRLAYHSKIVLIVTAFLIGFSSVFFLVVEYNGAFALMSLPDKIFNTVLQAITPRTAGFATVSQSIFSPIVQFCTVILMFIGGSPGSIAGGVKTTTFIVVVLYAIRGNTERTGLNMKKRNVETATVEKAFSIVSKSAMIIFGSISLLLISESTSLGNGTFSIFDLIFEVVSAFATVGLSLGVTSELTVWGKIIIICTMFIGRTGIFAMALGFARNEDERFFEYPSATILIG